MTGRDPAVLLALNAAHEAETSALDMAGLEALLGKAVYVGLRGESGSAGFLIAMDQDADYASPNFLWFRRRYPRFVYVDRVIVAPTARGKGLARSLYEELFDVARSAGHPMIAAEIVAAPPNLASDAFHAAMGFAEVGRSVAGDRKPVRYVAKQPL